MTVAYKDYIESADWFNRCRRFFGDTPMCAVRECRRRYFEGRVQIHHRTYVRLGRELSTDLVPLCDNCHGKAHSMAKYYLDHEPGLTKAEALSRGTISTLFGGGSRDLADLLEAAEKEDWPYSANGLPAAPEKGSETEHLYKSKAQRSGGVADA